MSVARIRSLVTILSLISLCSAFGTTSTTYDYIIVGGGTAGGALAARLSQGLPDHSVLLIEAGPSAPDELKINVPSLRGSTINGPYDWNFTSVPQSQTANRSWDLPRGKVLGGSSALNFMLWNRASVADYDAWEEFGNPGWNWDSLSQNMVRSENFTNTNLTEAGLDVRGTQGPTHTTLGRYMPEHQYRFRAALESLGVPGNREPLSGHPLGVGFHPGSVNAANWTRSYSANAYLPQAESNLEALLNTRVVRVNLDDCASGFKRATGVTLEDGSVILAQQEVILSAGSLQSPGLLELSGIGQKEVLDNAGIDQLIDIPGVGENLQDHVRVQLVWPLKDGYTSEDQLTYNSTFAAEQLALWEHDKFSVYDELPANMIALLNYKQAFGDDSALLALAESELGNSTNAIDQKILALILDDTVAKIEVILIDGYLGAGQYPSPHDPNYGNDYVSIVIGLMHTASHGNIHIASSDIATPPILDPQYLDREHDTQALVEMTRFARKIAQTKPLSDILLNEYEPGLDVVSDTQEDLEGFARNNSLSFYHLTSTCAMLPREDGGVVDPELRVYGTTNLRVVDASVIPVLIASHTQTAVYAIAERAAEIIIKSATST